MRYVWLKKKTMLIVLYLTMNMPTDVDEIEMCIETKVHS